jgi:hypothetical protein
MPDPEMIAVAKIASPAERAAMSQEMTRRVRDDLRRHFRKSNPEWTNEMVDAAVRARCISDDPLPDAIDIEAIEREVVLTWPMTHGG